MDVFFRRQTLTTRIGFGAILAFSLGSVILYPDSAMSSETEQPYLLDEFTENPVDFGSIGPQEITPGPGLVAPPPPSTYLQRREDFLTALAHERAVWSQEQLSADERKKRRTLLKHSMLSNNALLQDLWDMLAAEPGEQSTPQGDE